MMDSSIKLAIGLRSSKGNSLYSPWVSADNWGSNISTEFVAYSGGEETFRAI